MKAKKLPSGHFRVQVVAGYDEHGKRIVKSFTAEEEWEALKKATDFIAERDNSYDDSIILETAFKKYIQSKKNIIEETTYRAYNQVLQHRFKSLMDIRLRDLTPIQIQQALNQEAETVSPKTVKNAYGLLKSVLKIYNININLTNVCPPKMVKKTKDLPTFETIYNIVQGSDIELPVLLASWLSLRIGEVIGLQFKDVDYNKKLLYVKRTIIQTEDGYKLRDSCKTEKSTRTLQLPDYLYNLICQIPHKNNTDFIVPLTAKALRSRFTRRVNKHNIHMTFHDLRHLNASVMLMLGVPDKYAMERGGWSTDIVLKSVYQQTFSNERIKNDKIIDTYFNGIVSKNHTKSHDM